jgi:PAS domain-containing protein
VDYGPHLTQTHCTYQHILMPKKTNEFRVQVATEVAGSKNICVAIDKELHYLAFNEAACAYLKIRAADLLGKSALQVYPEIIASRNHRNILRALSGEVIVDDLVESRMGNILKASYRPVFVNKEVQAVILDATVFLSGG